MEINLYQLEKQIGSDEFVAALKKIDFDYCEYAVSVLEKTFPNIYKTEYAGQESNYNDFCHIYLTTAKLLMRHFDETGLTAAIGKAVKHLENFSFTQHTALLAFDDNYLKKNLKVKPEKVDSFWKHCEESKAELFKVMAEPGFSLEKTVEFAMRTLTQTDCPEWQYGSKSRWVKVAGAALTAVNIACALGAITGVGAAVAVASAAAGSAGMLL